MCFAWRGSGCDTGEILVNFWSKLVKHWSNTSPGEGTTRRSLPSLTHGRFGPRLCAGKVVKRWSNRDEAAGGVEGEAGGAAEEEGPARGQHGSPEEVRHVPRVRGCRGVTDGSQGVMHRGFYRVGERTGGNGSNAGHKSGPARVTEWSNTGRKVRVRTAGIHARYATPLCGIRTTRSRCSWRAS